MISFSWAGEILTQVIPLLGCVTVGCHFAVTFQNAFSHNITASWWKTGTLKIREPVLVFILQTHHVLLQTPEPLVPSSGLLKLLTTV